jgi:hypothetical protein
MKITKIIEKLISDGKIDEAEKLSSLFLSYIQNCNEMPSIGVSENFLSYIPASGFMIDKYLETELNNP